MNLYIDCEFNGGLGDLISMALVDEYGREFYEVLPCPNPEPWIVENVIPILGKAPVTLAELQDKLWRFLCFGEKLHIIADHPADLAYFFETLIVNAQGGWLSIPPVSAEIIPHLDYKSAIPHNALEDAKAIRVVVIAMLAEKEKTERG